MISSFGDLSKAKMTSISNESSKNHGLIPYDASLPHECSFRKIDGTDLQCLTSNIEFVKKIVFRVRV